MLLKRVSMEKKKMRKQIVFDVHPDLHKRIKVTAAKLGISMNLFMSRAIFDLLNKISNQGTT